MSGPATLADSLRLLQERGLPRLEAQMLVLQAIGQPPEDRAWLLAHDEQVLTPAQSQELIRSSQRRLDGEPMAYILGVKAFHGLTLSIDGRVLDPRDDTETLVDWALEVGAPQQALDVVDLGTGSGAIALALAQARPAWRVSGVDASTDALAVARHNAQRLGLKVSWTLGSWLSPLAGRRHHLIVSNPPYIAEGDPHLAGLRHEPREALVSGPDGLDDLRQIIQAAPEHLHAGGWLLLEHGHDQAAAVRKLLRQAGLEAVSSRRDLAGIERCSGGHWPAKQGFASREII
jgi:release factor glutamine methyltransferase